MNDDTEKRNRWLRHKQDGTIYGWDPILAANSLTEEVSYEEAFPHRNAPKLTQRATALPLHTADIPEPPNNTTHPQDAEQLGRSLPSALGVGEVPHPSSMGS